MKKIIALIKTKGKTKKEITDEARKVLGVKKMLDEKGKLHITKQFNFQKDDKLNSKK